MNSTTWPPAGPGTASAAQLPRARWGEALADFSRRHRGWLLQTWALSPGGMEPTGRDRELAVGLPLRAVELDDHGPRPAIVVRFGDLRGDERGLALQRIDDPRTLAVAHTPSGEVAGLDIVDAAGHETRLRFRVTPPPETLNGLADAEH